MEIIDSRYQNFKFALPDVIADNSSSSGFVVGDWSRPDQDFSNLGLVMEVDGRPVEIGSTAAILGNPSRSLVAAARLAGAALGRLEAGWIILAGGATAAHSLKVGERVRLTMQNLGSVSIRVDGVGRMPIVEITMIEGRSAEAKRRLIAKVTDSIIEAIEAPRDSIRIILREIPALHFGAARQDQGKDRTAARLTGA